MRLHVLKCTFVALALLAAGGKASSAGIPLKAAPALQAITGMVARWPCDTITGGVSTPDVVSTNDLLFDATPAAPTAVTGVFSNGIKLNGTNDHLAAADNAALNFGNTSFTVALWCRPANTAAARLINKWDGPAQQGWLMDTHSNGGGGAVVGSIRFRLDSDNTQNTGADNLDFAVAANLDSGNWRHLAAVVDRTAGNVKLYMDGNLIGPAGGTAIPGTLGSVTNTFQLAVGNIPSSPAKWFNGDVDDIRLYNKALSGVEVDALYNGWYTVIAAGNPGPVGPKRGLLGAYYNSTTNLGTAPTPSSPTSNIAPQDVNSTLITRQLDRVINSDMTTALPAGVNADNFYVEWTGFIITEAAGDYTITTRVDDGTRAWFNQNPLTTTPDIQSWTTQGPTDYSATFNGLTAQTAYPFRWEFFEGSVTQFAGLLWVPSGAVAPVPPALAPAIPTVNLRPPAGPDAPGGLTAVATAGSATPQIVVTWNASNTPIAATSYVLSRATTSGGPYTQVAVLAAPTTTFTDNTVAFGSTYYYVVQGTATNTLQVGPIGTESTPATPQPPAVSVSPTGITTSETGTTVPLTLTVNVQPAAAGTIQITSSAPLEALVSGQGNGDAAVQGPAGTITIHINSGTPAGTTFTINVTGQPDDVDDGDQPYTISFLVNGGGATWTSNSVSDVTGTNLDINTAAILASPTAGLRTDTNGGTDQFTVRLNSKPVNPVTVTVVSSDPTEGTVSSPTLSFDGTNWDQTQTITLTGQGTNISYVNTPYQINLGVQAGSDSAYIGKTATVSALNLHLEAPPNLKKVWGCGLSGLEIFIPLGILSLLRRRRRNS